MNTSDLSLWCASPKFITSPPGYRVRPLVMGILNLTPDSFSDGGDFLKTPDAVQQAEKMIAEGADLVDLGAESSRPGAVPVPAEQELERLIPVIQDISKSYDIAISVDTYKPDVMREAVRAGAGMINDIYALRTPGALEMAASLDVPVCLMHMQGAPNNMQIKPNYSNGVVASIQAFFDERIKACEHAGIKREHLILDPGFGFGKSVAHNLALTQQLQAFQSHERPLLLGVSRKSTLGAVLQQEVAHRLPGALGVTVFAALHGVTMIRTHDVGETKQALDMVDAIVQAKF
ncbi:MAG: dihydropteroate synthase [Legionellaceae bacterium]|nr:dihydropteroate synthase [Legionellaceae bacterium]